MAKYTIINFIDDPTSKKTLTLALEKADFRVVEVTTCEAVLDMLVDGDAQAIFVESNDVRDEGMNHLLKLAQTPNREVPILVLTSHLDAKMKRVAAEAGVTSWIAKPYHPTGLISGLYKVLERNQNRKFMKKHETVSVLKAVG